MADGGDEQAADEHPADEHPADEQPADEHPADEQPADEHPADEHPADEHPADEHPADEHPADEHPADEHPADEHPAEAIRFFLVGSPRSGTTLLRALLDSHPRVAVPPEANFFVPLLRRRRDLERDPVAVDALLWYLRQNPSFGEWGLGEEAVQHAWTPPPRDVPAALDALYAAYARAHAATVVGDKTPHHVRVIPLLAAAFPDARFVHLVRDGRDVAASLSSSHFGPSSFARAADRWQQNVDAGRRAGAGLGPARYLELRYESLVTDTESELEQLCAFLDLDYDPAMLRYPERAGEVLGGMRRDDHLQGIHRAPTLGRDWRTELAPRDVEVFEALTRELTAALAYPLVTDHDRPTVRAEVAVRRLAWAAAARARRTRKQLGRRIGHRPDDKAAALASRSEEASPRRP